MPAELATLSSPGKPAVAASKVSICASVIGTVGSSARAKWVILTMLSALPLACSRSQAAR